jgi:Ca2+-binding RTX toxin-like protein
MTGGAGSDTMFGDAGADQLVGGDGKDFLFGGDGNDLLKGRQGNDYMNGGAGDDTVLMHSNDTVVVGEGHDTLAIQGAVAKGNVTVLGFSNAIAAFDFTDHAAIYNAGTNTWSVDGGSMIIKAGDGHSLAPPP